MKKLIKAGEITPVDVEVEVPDPVPPKPKPVLWVATEWRGAKAGEYYLSGGSEIFKAVADTFCSVWLPRQIIDPPLVTAEQFEAIAEVVGAARSDSRYDRLHEAFGTNRNTTMLSSFLRDLADRARECGLVNGAV